MKFSLSESEWYPVQTLCPEGKGWNEATYPAQDFSEEEIVDLRRVTAEFQAWQNKIAERFGNEDALFSDKFDLIKDSCP